MHYYFMHGLYFASDICLYDIKSLTIVGCKCPDVTIMRDDDIRNELDEQKDHNTFFSKNRIWIKTDVGYFWVENGNIIKYTPVSGALVSDISSFIIGWSICILLYQRGKMGIHCSALSYRDRSFLVSGASGAGKSTTAQALIKHGCKYYSDDLTFLSMEDGYVIYPSLPLLKICGNNIGEKNNYRELTYIDEDRDKYAVVDTENFETAPKKLSTIFLLEISRSSLVEHALLMGADKIPAVLHSLYMAQIFEQIGYPLPVQSACLKIAGNVRIVSIKRPKGMETTDEICEIIERYMEESCLQ